MSITIAKAVGLNAKAVGGNLFNDVIKIQWLLNHFRGLGRFHGSAVTIDGDCGPKTRTAITAFQIQNGLLSEEHFYGQIRPHGLTMQFVNKNAGNIDFVPKIPKSTKWMTDTVEQWRIKRDWGEEIYNWVMIPPDGKEAKEFSPPNSMRRDYKTVFVWKSPDPKKDCPVFRDDMVQILAKLRDDRAYWEWKTARLFSKSSNWSLTDRDRGRRIELAICQEAAETAIRDYRLFIVDKKLCPPAAHQQLLQINKDTIYEMFLGMFQLLSPVGATSVGGGFEFAAEIFGWLSKGEETGEYKPWKSGDPGRIERMIKTEFKQKS